MATPVKLIISGCAGRMGQRIATLVREQPSGGLVVASAVEAPGHPAIGQDLGALLGASPFGVIVVDDVRWALGRGEVLIEFTRPSPTLEHVRIATELRKPMVIGTTGFQDGERAIIQEAAAQIPIVLSPNMSLGVNVLFELATLAAQRLGLRYDVEIVETHHKAKQDSPSGTAKRLAEAVAAGRGVASNSIPMHALRVGDVVGDHTVVFAGPSERIELTHRAQSRDVFALGALKAAQFVHRQRPGLYDMTDVLKAHVEPHG